MSTTHTIRYYRELEREVFPSIPGMQEIAEAAPEERDLLAEKYPDAVFALMVADSLICGVRDISAINQKAYLAILNGESIPNIRFRYNKEMDDYISRHNWDD